MFLCPSPAGRGDGAWQGLGTAAKREYSWGVGLRCEGRCRGQVRT